MGATLTSKRRKKHTKNSRVGKGDKKSFSSAGESQFQTFDPSSCPKGLLLLSLSWRLCPRVWKSQKKERKRKETFFFSTLNRYAGKFLHFRKSSKLCAKLIFAENYVQNFAFKKKSRFGDLWQFGAPRSAIFWHKNNYCSQKFVLLQ